MTTPTALNQPLLKSILLSLLLVAPAFGQTMYQCPNAAGVVNFQQLPCTPQGGGKALPVKALPAGTGSGLSDNAKEYMAGRDQYWNEKAKADTLEANRQEGVNIERNKVKAAKEQAAAQRAVAHAIWATGGRRY